MECWFATIVVVLAHFTTFTAISTAADDSSSGAAANNEPHTRQKRFLWITSDGRLALPPGTTLVIAPSLSMPFIRYPPDGFFSNMTISLPFTIDFNKLGLTDNENPYGVIHPLLARSMGRAAGNILLDYIKNLISGRKKRSADSSSSSDFVDPMPDHVKHIFHGGERALLYPVVEDFLANFGMDGKACLLRAICEVHAFPIDHWGFLGEILKLFFTASKSPFSEILEEYIEAEQIGSDTARHSGGDCSTYMLNCPKSLFRIQQFSQNNDISTKTM